MSLSSNKKTFVLILLAFCFSFALRLIWVYQFSDTEQFKFNNEFMINTNDGYFYAEGSRDNLSGVSQKNDLSPIDSATSKVTAFIVSITPFSIETILFYLPAFFSSLVVVPIILIARKFDQLEVGFISAIFASIAWSYYNRTMVGYYDTDMLNIVFPMLLLWSLIWAIETKKDIYLLITAIDVIAYRWWYPQSYALEFAFWGLILVYLVYQIYQNRTSIQKHYESIELAYTLQLLSIMMLAMVQVDMMIRVMLVAGYFMLFSQKRWHKHLYIMFGMIVLLFLATGGFDPIWGKLKGYVFKDHIISSIEGLRLHFYTTMQTVREAGQIPFETFANRISGHTITFIIACIGYIVLVYKHRVMLLSLPMLGLGFLALSGGLRFTIYAVPVLALGLGYIIVEFSRIISQKLNPKSLKIIHYPLIIILTIAVLYPNIKHIVDYKVPTVMVKQEVKVLDKLKNIASREDYVISWWDYGYPIRYYSDVKTLSDGGKHSGAVNYPTSLILTNTQNIAAKMARLDVEYTEKRFNKTPEDKWARSNIEQMTVNYGFKNTNDFLTYLESDIKLPKKTRDVYLYLPNRMMGIVPTIELFSNIDLMTGDKKRRSFFYQSKNFRDTGKTIELGNNISILKSKGALKVGNKTIKINNFVITQYDKKGKLQKRVQTIDKNSTISVIYMKSYNTFLVLDRKMYNSTYIQLFALENYDSTLYEPVIMTPLSKVFKLKI